MRMLFTFLFFTLFFSCKDDLDGECSTPFKVEVSKPALADGSKSYTINIKNKEGWWLSSVAVNGQVVQLDAEDRKTGNSFLIEKELFVFEKVSNTQAKVLVNNPNVVDRIVIYLQAANCSESIRLD